MVRVEVGRAADAPTFVGASSPVIVYTNGGTDRTVAIPKPSGVQAGDVLVAQVFDSLLGALTVPAGWSLVAEREAGAHHLGVYLKVAGSSEPSSYSWTGAPESAWPYVVGSMSAYRGVDGLEPVVSAAIRANPNAGGTGTSASSASIPVGVENAMIHTYATFQTYDQTYTPPSGATVDYHVWWNTDARHFAGTHDVQAAPGVVQRTFASTGIFNSPLVAIVALRPAGDMGLYPSPVRMSEVAGLGGASVTVTLPVTVSPGDVLVAVAYSSFGRTIAVPAGWTQIDQSGKKAVLLRVADGTDPPTGTYSFSNTGGTDIMSVVLGVYRNAEFPVEAHVLSSPAGSTSTPTADPLTPGGANRMIVSWVAAASGTGSPTITAPPSGMATAATQTNNGDNSTMGLADVVQPGTGSVAPSWTLNTSVTGSGVGTVILKSPTDEASAAEKRARGILGRLGFFGPTGMIVRADPVNTGTGAFIHSESDLDLPGTGIPFSFSRTYTSEDPTVGRLGKGWTDNLAVALTILGNGDVEARGDEGQVVSFVKQPDNSFVASDAVQARLESIAGGYRLTRHSQEVYEFNTAGRLSSAEDRNGQGLALAYNGAGELASVTDAAGRVSTFTHTGGLLTGVTASDGRTTSYAYTSGRLTSFTDVRGKVWTYTYDVGGRVATIVDPLGHTQVSNVYGTDGRVASQTDAVGKTTTFAWDSATGVASITDPNGNVWKDDYDSEVLAKEIDPLNQVTELGHDADLNDTSVKGPTNETTSMTFDANGNMLTATAPASLGSVSKTLVYNAVNDPTSVTDARGTVTTYGYDAAGNQTSVAQAGTTVGTMTYDGAGRVLTSTDANNKTTTYTYDAVGNTESVTDPLGNKTTYTYDDAGRVLTRVEPKGNVVGCGCAAQYTWSTTYNAAGQVLTETDPLGNVTTSTYDDAGNLATSKDANNKVTTYGYDNANRVVSVTAPDGGVSLTSYDDAGNKLTETDPLGHVTTHAYDDANRLVSTTTASGAKTTFFYDANSNLIKQIEPRGNVGGGVVPDDYATTFTYDAAGRMLTETDPLGHVTTHAHDAVGNELTVTDPNGKVTTNTYDSRNRLSTVTAPDTGVTTFTYDAVGNKLTETDPRSNVTTYTYDDANRTASVTKPAGGKTTYGYDPSGNQTSMVEPRGNVTGCGCAATYTWTYAYDRANRRTSETSPLGHVTAYALDSVGNQLSVTDAKSHVTSFTYDAVNRVQTVTAPDLGVTSHTYDVAGNRIQTTDPRNNTTSFGFDADNRRVSVTRPLSRTWTTAYDAAGNKVSTIDANGNATPALGDGLTSYTYDRAGRLTTIDYSDTTPDVTYSYDNAGNRLSMVDGSGTETRTYDNVNRLKTVVRGTDTFSYNYDLAGNLTSRTVPSSFQTTYTYDASNRLATVAADSLTTTYGYDVADNVTSTTLPAASGLVETRIVDASGRLAEVNMKKGATVRARFVVTRDQVGNPTQVVRTGSVAQTQVYGYDVNDRITSVCFQASCPLGTDPKISWTYDLVGNRLTETRTTGTVTSSYNAADQLTAAGATAYTYDANGNELSAGARSFTYDLANRTKTTTLSTTTTTYLYDGDGKRLQASTGTAASAKTNFIWDVTLPNSQVAVERNGGNVLQRRYTYGLQRIRQANGTASYYAHDPLGSVAGLLSNTGGAQRSWTYEPYGTIRTSTGTSPANLVQFTGEYLDPTGLYHLRARQYDPTIGRFGGLDPVEADVAPGVSSSYLYVGGRPLVLLDPTGETWLQPSPAGVDSAMVAATPTKNRPKDKPKNDVRYCNEQAKPSMEALNCLSAKSAADWAFDEANRLVRLRRIKGGIKDGTPHNAIKHSLWNAVMTQMFGRAKAAFFATKHEATEQELVDYNFSAGEIELRRMDLHNNYLGRIVGEDVENNFWPDYVIPPYSDLMEVKMLESERRLVQTVNGKSYAGNYLWVYQDGRMKLSGNWDR